MMSDENLFKDELKKLNLEQKFQLLRYHSRSEMSSFINTKKNLNPLVEAQLMVLAPYLFLPSELRKTLLTNGSKLAKKQDWDRVASRYLNLYDNFT